MTPSFLLLILLALFHYVHSIGMVIEPCLEGDPAQQSSLINLRNCLAYHTNNNDLIMVKIVSGPQIQSQTLNLKIFDSENNLLRVSNNLVGEITIIMKNLNNDPIYDEGNSKRSRANIIDRLAFLKSDEHKAQQLLNNNKGKNLIYVCFDNLYSDKSWSFHPENREIELTVDLRDVSKMQGTDYNLYSKYFHKFQSTENSDHRMKDMSQVEFDDEIAVIENELNDVVENLKNSAIILKNIQLQESRLRDINEQIFAGYTFMTVLVLVAIVGFGIFQTVYVHRYLTKKVIY
ncbi:hypothetical protein CANTEDRAFT_93757 [Yamadazyma tenuis ATCC 10573]|uniref:GOLD domain-containing protein n=1 Tax=Candida tenuis (strain ATCC 10573 / BCRC 21748 / CBS 615 / JCM 9827 / NBRC 10315 / NRRL Y-1498 / VKM Y-70) TaxID=590646 RepID=G3B6P1_CANTC|nr:uncharacterized protein CANTEDRAFT_93757 [Yamadazyma tenuis ATCC 10573]EGV62980.1 hypothetical protein CANTEDRAFT_93757 [Yamadazyma tenuis ATCC 10573]